MGSAQIDASNRSRPFRFGREVLDWEELREVWEVRYGVDEPEFSPDESVSSLSAEDEMLVVDTESLWLYDRSSDELSYGSESIGGGDDNGEELKGQVG